MMMKRPNLFRQLVAILCALTLSTTAARADGEPAGVFDYWVMALSWSPSWCAAEGDDRGSVQCQADAGHGWVLHGLWPQYERGWPSWCPSGLANPSRSETAAMADIMGTGGSAWHQWKKHGRCSGLAASDYFAVSRRAYDRVTRPPIFRKLPGTVRISPDVVERAFLEMNEAIEPDGLTVTCRGGRIAEVRICLTRDLDPRVCGADVRQDCRAMSEMPAMR